MSKQDSHHHEKDHPHDHEDRSRSHNRDHGHTHSGHSHQSHTQEGHSHAHGNSSRLLAWATVITIVFMLVEGVGGLLAHSLTLLADAGHMFTDAAALALAWSAVYLSQRKADSKRSFGYHRAQVLATFINGIALLVVVVWIAFEAAERMLSPVAINAPLMLIVALAGTLVNIVLFAMLRHGDHDDMNISAAILHVISDLLGSVGAVIAAIVIQWTGWLPIDPILSVLLCALIVRSAWALVKKSAHILLEGAPDWLDVQQLRLTLQAQVPTISDVHHVHCWSLSPRETLLTMHATIRDSADHDAVLAKMQQVLTEHYGITHCTIQVEHGVCVDGSDADDCVKHG